MSHATPAKPAGNISEASLLNQAGRLFSRGLIDHLSATGHDIIESRGQGAYLFDINDQAYIDGCCGAGAYNLGRNPEQVQTALQRAARQTDCGNFILISEEKATLAERLAWFMGGNLSCCLFTVVRGEAMDAACKLARGHTGKRQLIAANGGWHGQTGFAMGLSRRPDKDLFGRLIPDQTIVEFNDINAAEKAFNHDTAAFILEPVQAENGCSVADKDYLASLKQLCREYGALLIFDETQTGFGRLGYKFAKDCYGVEPDILLFGEAVTAGVFPMTGLVFTPGVKSFFDIHPLIHLCTFGGHDVGCQVGVRALEIYAETRPWENAAKQGNVLRSHLTKLKDDFPDLISHVHGLGLLLAVTFKEESLARSFCMQAKNCGVLVVQAAVDKKSVVFRPALTLTNGDTGRLMSSVTSAMQALQSSWRPLTFTAESHC